jgi:serine/threonine protein kinase
VDYIIPDYISEGILIILLKIVDCKSLITNILQFEPNARPTTIEILDSEWLADVSIEEKPQKAISPELPLGATQEEVILAAKLSSIGIDISSLLDSVHSNMCDQSSALWYLLLEKERKNKVVVDKPIHKSAKTSRSQTLQQELDKLKNLESEKESNFAWGGSISISIPLDFEKHFSDAKKRAVSIDENPILMLSRITAALSVQTNSPTKEDRSQPVSPLHTGGYSGSPRGNKLCNVAPSPNSSPKRYFLPNTCNESNDDKEEQVNSIKPSNNRARPKSGNRVKVRQHANLILEEFETE